MTKAEFEMLFIDAMNDLRKQSFVPYDTGNLKFNAIKGIWVSDKQFKIYIDKDVAPYADILNKQGDTKPNQHAGWETKAFKHVGNYLAFRLGGTVT